MNIIFDILAVLFFALSMPIAVWIGDRRKNNIIVDKKKTRKVYVISYVVGVIVFGAFVAFLRRAMF